MYEIKVISEFSGAHRLRHYKGKCEDLHGHNWKVEASVASLTLDKKSMVLDFKELKKKLKKILDGLDHTCLNELPYFRRMNPTSENIAKFIYDRLSIKPSRITVWETDASAASYYE